MFSTQTDDDYKINIPLTFNGYDIIEYIDNGSFSAVVKVQDRLSKQFFAAKIISKNDLMNKNQMKVIKNEIDILCSINHPNIIKFYKSFEIRNSQKEEFIVIIEEFCKNGNLVKYLTEFGLRNEKEKKEIELGLISAIGYLHEREIAHCDIKLDNILIDENHQAKLCDFGLSIRVKNSQNVVRWGTVGFNSPELYKDGDIDFIKSDIWSLGITLYGITELELPYQSLEDAENCNLAIQTCNDRLRVVVEKCTRYNPIQRPRAKDLLKELYFSFYNYFIDYEKIYQIKKNSDIKFKTETISFPENDVKPIKTHEIKLYDETNLKKYDNSCYSGFEKRNEKQLIDLYEDKIDILEKKKRKSYKNAKNKKANKRKMTKKTHKRYQNGITSSKENEDAQYFIFFKKLKI